MAILALIALPFHGTPDIWILVYSVCVPYLWENRWGLLANHTVSIVEQSMPVPIILQLECYHTLRYELGQISTLHCHL